MDYKQFMRLMEPGNEPGKESINSLQEFVNEFPYFQSAQILLAKSMHDQQHVRYERQLKIAAAYAGDRKALYNLIHSKSEKLVHEQIVRNEPVILSVPDENIKESENIFLEVEENPVVPPFDDEIEGYSSSEINLEPHPSTIFYKEPVESIELEIEEVKESVAADPHDIIRKRLNEILGLKKEEEEKKIISISEAHIEKIPRDETALNNIPGTRESEIEEIRIEEKHDQIETENISEEKPKDVIELAQMESALETTIIQSLEKLPLIQKTIDSEKETEIKTSRNEHSFYDWLKIKSTPGYGKIEEVHADEAVEVENVVLKISEEAKTESYSELTKEKSTDVSHLIDRFLEADPKIIPSKKEFYSPASQAKKSVTENEDLVSETLAKIYYQQGNFLKARSSYQRLSLLYPEKMAYFAALISEVEKAINNLDKQDL